MHTSTKGAQPGLLSMSGQLTRTCWWLVDTHGDVAVAFGPLDGVCEVGLLIGSRPLGNA